MDQLTKRQKEVLGLVLQGCSNRQISNALSISNSTVKFHCNNLFRHYGANSRYQLFHLVSQHNQQAALVD